jgi:hypothetical protein
MSTGRPVMVPLLAMMKPHTPYTAPGLAQAIGCRRMAAYQALERMAGKQQIGRRVVGGGNVYFCTQEQADEFSTRDAAVLAEQLRHKRAENLATNKARVMATVDRNRVRKERPGRPAPVVIAQPPPESKSAPRPVDMSSAVWTIAKTPVCRFAVDPASIKPGAFVIDMPAGRWSDYAVRGAA